MTDEIADEFAKEMEDNIKQSVKRKFDRFDGDLHDKVDSSKKSSSGDGNLYEVSANAYSSTGVNYAAWHEYASTGHTAPVTGDLKRWALDRGIYNDIGTGLYVTPMNQKKGSFMTPAIQKTISKKRRELRSGNNPVTDDMRRNFK